MRARPRMKKDHSSALGCQCISRMPWGSTVTCAAATVLLMGKLLVSVIRTSPPGALSGSCVSILCVKRCRDFLTPTGFSLSIGPGTDPSKM